MKHAVPLTAAALAICLGGAATPATAQQCGTFTDVFTTDFYCEGTQWLRNRSITSGCGASTYCPNNPVSRAQMAFFLRQTGIVLTPQRQARQSGTAAANIPAGQFQAFCFGTALPAANYPRTAIARGHVNIPATGPQMGMFLAITFDNQPYGNMNSTFNVVTNPNGTTLMSWSSDERPVPVGQTVGFAIGISNPAGAGTLNLSPGVCALDAEVNNANPTSAPFDEQ